MLLTITIAIYDLGYSVRDEVCKRGLRRRALYLVMPTPYGAYALRDLYLQLVVKLTLSTLVTS